MKKSSPAELNLPYHPWPYFLLFLLVHFLLSAAGLSITASLFVFLFGLALPLGLGAFTLRKGPAPSGKTLELFHGPVPWPAWFALGAAALWLRFGGLGSSSWWPGEDEALTGMGALALLRHWNWDLFEVFGQIPTTLSRLCCLFLGLTHAPLFSLQFSSAFLSALAVPVGYLACRKFFPRPLAVLVVFLLALGFWPLATARWGYPSAPFILWEVTVFYLLGKILSIPGQGKGLLLFLGLVAGLGPYTWTSWPVVVVFLLAVLAFRARKTLVQSLPGMGIFLLGFFITLGPFGVYVLEGRYGQHLLAVSVWGHFSPLDEFEFIAHYLGALFWDHPPQSRLFGLGGFMNVVLGASFWVGLLELFRLGKKGLALGMGLLLFLLPGFLSLGFEPLRILSTLPLLLVVAALGLQALALALPLPWRVPGLALLLLLITGIDSLRLYCPLDPTTLVYKGEGLQVYEDLQPYLAGKKPGFIFSEMVPEASKPSFAYSTYFQNAAWDKDIPAGDVQWAAVLVDNHYQPFLLNRFPGSQWIPLPSPEAVKQGPRVLGVIPVTEGNRALFMQWRDFYGCLQDLNWEILDLSNGIPRTRVLEDLLAFYPQVPADPFLQSCFFEKLVFNYTWEQTFYPGDETASWQKFSPVLHAAFAKSYHDPDLCQKFGRLLVNEGQLEDARAVFREALKSSPRNPWILEQMKEFGLMN